MKNKIIAGLAFAAAMFLSATSANAQSKKFGFLNSMEILSLLPEMKDVQTQLDTYGAELEKDYQTMISEYQKKATELQDLQKKGGTSDALMQIKVQELQEMEARLQKTSVAFEEELVEKQQKLMLPLAEKVEAAIKEVAKEKGISYVFDSGKGLLLYADEADDISQAVKDKLKIVAPPTNTGGK